MIYREYLVMCKAVAWYLGVLLAMMLTVVIASRGGGNSNGDYSMFIAPATWGTVIFSAVFGVALGNASRAPARVMWVLPTDRWKSALQVIGVDFIAIFVVYLGLFALAVLYLLIAKAFGGDVDMRDVFDWASAFQSLCFIYAVYGWGALVGMIGRRVAYLGIVALPALELWAALSRFAGPFGALLRFPIVMNPVAIFNMGMELDGIGVGRHPYRYDQLESWLSWMGTSWETPVLIAITIATCAAATLLWQRSETLAT